MISLQQCHIVLPKPVFFIMKCWKIHYDLKIPVNIGHFHNLKMMLIEISTNWTGLVVAALCFYCISCTIPTAIWRRRVGAGSALSLISCSTGPAACGPCWPSGPLSICETKNYAQKLRPRSQRFMHFYVILVVKLFKKKINIFS